MDANTYRKRRLKHAEFFTPEMAARMYLMYTLDQQSLRQIAAGLGCSHPTVSKVMRSHGYPTRRNSEAGRTSWRREPFTV